MKFNFILKTVEKDNDYKWISYPQCFIGELNEECENVLNKLQNRLSKINTKNIYYITDGTYAVAFKIMLSQELDQEGRKIYSLEGLMDNEKRVWDSLTEIVSYIYEANVSMRDLIIEKTSFKRREENVIDIEELYEKNEEIEDLNSFKYLEYITQNKKPHNIIFGDINNIMSNVTENFEIIEINNKDYEIPEPLQNEDEQAMNFGRKWLFRNKFNSQLKKKENEFENNEEVEANKKIIEIKLGEDFDIKFIKENYKFIEKEWKIEIFQTETGFEANIEKYEG